jgi:hypothetical protein
MLPSGGMGMPIRHYVYVVVAVTTFLATYLLVKDEQQASSAPARQLEYVQDVARALKSDPLALKKEVEDHLFGPKLVRLEKYDLPADDKSSDLNSPKQEQLAYLADYTYSEVPPDKKPADIVLDALRDIPVGTPVEEINRASEAFGLDFNFMKAVAKIESDFDPKQRTGSYLGLFQLSNYEFAKYGSGDVLNHARERSGATHFPKSNTFGNPSTI